MKSFSAFFKSHLTKPLLCLLIFAFVAGGVCLPLILAKNGGGNLKASFEDYDKLGFESGNGEEVDAFVASLESLGGNLAGLSDWLEDICNGGGSVDLAEEDNIITGCDSRIVIAGLSWMPVSVFSQPYNSIGHLYPGDYMQALAEGEDSEIIVTLVGDPENGIFSPYHLATEDYDVIDTIPFNAPRTSYVYNVTLGYGLETYNEKGDMVDPTDLPQPEIEISEIFARGAYQKGMLSCGGIGLPTVEQFDKYRLGEYCSEQAMLLATNQNVLDIDIDYATENDLLYEDEHYMFLQDEKLRNRGFWVGTGDGTVRAAIYTSEGEGPGQPGSSGYAYDNQYLVLPIMQLDLTKLWYVRYSQSTPPDVQSVGQTHIITFDFNKGNDEKASLEVREGQAWPIAPVPSRKHYVFCGYYLDSVQYYYPNGSPVNSTYDFSHGLTLTAKWVYRPSWTDYAADSFAGGAGTKSNPYKIATAEQLAKLANDLNEGTDAHQGEYFQQTANISLAENFWPGIAGGGFASPARMTDKIMQFQA